jgi:single-strand DNA-binding protein
MGHLGKDPETREFGENSVVNFSIAHTRKRKGKEPVTTWYKVSAWNKLGQLAVQYLKKGSAAQVIGEPYMETWEKDGQQRQQLCIEAANIVFLGGKTEQEPEEAQTVGEGVAKLKAAAGVKDGGIPF